MTLSSHPGPSQLKPLYKDLPPVCPTPLPSVQLGQAPLFAQSPGWPLSQGLPQGRGQAVMSPGGADLACCCKVYWGEQPQDLVSDVKGENRERV